MEYSCSIIYTARLLFRIPRQKNPTICPSTEWAFRELTSTRSWNNEGAPKRKNFCGSKGFQTSETFSETLVLCDKSISVPWDHQNPSNPVRREVPKKMLRLISTRSVLSIPPNKSSQSACQIGQVLCYGNYMQLLYYSTFNWSRQFQACPVCQKEILTPLLHETVEGLQSFIYNVYIMKLCSYESMWMLLNVLKGFGV